MLNFGKSSPWAAVLGLLSGVASAGVVFTGASVQIGDDYYFIDPHVAGELPVPPRVDHTSGFAAVTVVRSAGNATTLDALLQSWAALDDVFQASFLAGGVYIADSRLLTASPEEASSSQHQQRLIHPAVPVQRLPNGTSLPNGPYFLDVHTGHAHRALRLYDDFTGAFTGALLQSPDGSAVQTLSAQIPTAMTLTVGVPSRLYYTPTAAQPLAGVRLGVKDLFCVRGARRSNGSRAWYHLYAPCATSAPTVSRLVAAGAVVVGYNALAQFANGDRYTSDAVDMHMPFNPRGDGYTYPSGSSSGGGAALAAYPWLDLALGTDTGGSVRGPAQVAGLFGNRPTAGLAGALDGVTPLSTTLDAPGLLARDLEVWDAAQQVLYGANYTSWEGVEAPEFPRKVYVLGWPEGTRAEAVDMLERFVDVTVEVTGAEVEMLDLEALWKDTRPEEVGDVTLATYLNTTYATLMSTEQWNLVGKPFFADYAGKHDGRKPYVNPSADGHWAYARSLPPSAYPSAQRQQTTFQAWFRAHVLAATGDARCSSALLLYSDYAGAPDLRTRLRPIPSVRGLQTVYYSPLAGVPDFAFPIGEVRARSNITGEEEPLPVSADIMAAAGCDGLVTRLGMELVRKGAVKVPRTGSSLDGGEVLF